VFTNKPITAKPIEVWMRNGKGNLEHWAGFVQSGFSILEIISNINKLTVVSIVKSASIRLPLKTKVVFQ